MDLQTFFDELRQVHDMRAQALGDMKADCVTSARLIAAAEYELEALRRELKRGASAGTS